MRSVRGCLFVLVLATAAVAGCRSGDETRSAEECPAPTAAAVREASSRAAAVLRTTVSGRATLTDGVTTGDGLLVRVDAALAGTASPGRAALWPGVDTPDGGTIGVDTVLVVFARTHERATTADGAALPAYDIAVANGLLAHRPEGIVRLCKGGSSPAVDETVLDEL